MDERQQTGSGATGTETLKPWISIPLFPAESSSLCLRGKTRCGAGSLAGSQVCPGWVDCFTLPQPPPPHPHPPELKILPNLSLISLSLTHTHTTHINPAKLGHPVTTTTWDSACQVDYHVRPLMFVIKQSTLDSLCLTRSVRASIPQGESVEPPVHASYLLFHLFWALRARAEWPLTPLSAFVIGPACVFLLLHQWRQWGCWQHAVTWNLFLIPSSFLFPLASNSNTPGTFFHGPTCLLGHKVKRTDEINISKLCVFVIRLAKFEQKRVFETFALEDCEIVLMFYVLELFKNPQESLSSFLGDSVGSQNDIWQIPHANF